MPTKKNIHNKAWKTWKDINNTTANKIKRMLLDLSGIVCPVTNKYEEWRILMGDSVFIYYSKGTLFSTTTTDVDVLELRDAINKLIKSGEEKL